LAQAVLFSWARSEKKEKGGEENEKNHITYIQPVFVFNAVLGRDNGARRRAARQNSA
jgi:hypothetical protein